MGGVPVLLMVTLFGTLSAPYHQAVCVSQAADVWCFSASSSFAPSFSERGFVGTVRSESGFKGEESRTDAALKNQTHELDAVIRLVVDTAAVQRVDASSNANGPDFQQANDSSPVVIPELRSDSAECMLNAAINSRAITVRKPDNTGTGGSGFSFPSVPPSLVDTGQTLAQNVDRAGRPIAPAASAQGATNGTTFPSTTVATPQPFSVPPFTSSAGTAPIASIPSAQPISGRDTSNRATNWGQVPLPTTAPAASATTPSGFGSNPVPTTNALTSGNRSASASPLLPTDTFGRTPSGVAAATAGRASQPSYATGTRSTTNSGTPNFVHVPTTDSIFGRNQAASNNTATNFGAEAAASRTNRASTNANMLNSTGYTTNGQTVRGVPVGQPPIGRFGTNPSASFVPSSSTAYPPGTAGARPSTTGLSTSRPDTRLSAAQIAAGAWSVDAFGQPVDRAGQRIPSAYPNTNGQRLNQQAQATGATGFGSSFANQTASHMTQVRPHAVNGNSILPENTGMHFPKANMLPATGKQNEAARSSLASSRNNMTKVSETELIQTQSVTTQPLFNGLLLISIVANIYLIFWLKNLRLQYHEMVAAKRMASSNASSS
ncbi:hypothetical protein N9276_00125 [Rhodopirellula sp.]|nr:hypothetical protein [Rhodopirellula sp.]